MVDDGTDEGSHHRRVQSGIDGLLPRNAHFPKSGKVRPLPHVPDVPFVEADLHILGSALLRLDLGNDLLEAGEPLVAVGIGGEEFPISPSALFIIGIVSVAGDEVHEPVAFGEHRPVPSGEGGHLEGTAPAEDELYRGIVALHHHRRHLCTFGILLRRRVPDLPIAVHLVAEAPIFNVVGLSMPVLLAQFRPIPLCAVTVLKELKRLLRRPRAEVDRHDRLCAHLPAPTDELIHADLIGL